MKYFKEFMQRTIFTDFSIAKVGFHDYKGDIQYEYDQSTA